MNITADQLTGLLASLSRVRVTVVGDFCLDAYWSLDPAPGESSVETGLETRRVRTQRYAPGGAGNVAMNLLALGVREVRVLGVVGDDPYGRELRRLLQEAGADVEGLLTQGAPWCTHVYCKPCMADVEQNRIDFGNFNPLDADCAAGLLQHLDSAAKTADVLIVNQQVASGIHASHPFRAGLAAFLRRKSRPVALLDSREGCPEYTGTVRKLNDREALRLCGRTPVGAGPVAREDATAAAETLFRRWRQPLFVTRGARGCLVRDRQGLHEIPGLLTLGRTDPVGAGDSFLATLAATLGAGGSPEVAATLGNFAATVTVRKLGQTGTASPAEIAAVGADPDYIYHPELAADLRHARYLPGSEIEVVRDLPSGVRPTHAIFDHDGTISTLRQGWEEIMEPMMVRAVLGAKLGTVGEALYSQVVERVRTYIQQTTGIQTITQMKGLIEIIREFGCVPEGDLLSAAGYKEVYNTALMETVGDRIARLRRGEREVGDFVLKHAVPLLRRLHAAGVRLYLASGTDGTDVVREATELGYADLFEGRIHGSVGAVEKDAKRVVIDRILDEIGARNAHSLLAFGDGPVEIRETHKRGGVTIGVASDEVRRFGLNPAKRDRLIRAGADLVVPDFSELDRLLDALGAGADAPKGRRGGKRGVR